MATVTARIKKFNAGLLPDRIQLKYKAMSESSFRFFRGTCHLFYEDLAGRKDFPESPLTWICGDLHLENFGSFKGTNRQVYFDLNDFDESMLAPLNWEIARMLTSIYVAFDTLKLKKKWAEEMAMFFLEVYMDRLKKGKAYYIDPRTADGVVRTFLDNAALRKAKDMVKKNTGGKNAAGKDSELLIKINNQTHFKLEKKLKQALMIHLTSCLENTELLSNKFLVKDAVFRVAGTGSIGLKRYMLLLQSKKNPDKLLFLDLKEAVKSSLAPFNKVVQPKWTSEAERIITTKYRMQNVSPALLSTTIFKGDDFVMQELQPSADRINLASLSAQIKEIKSVIKDMAVLTASAQLRSAGIQGSASNDELTTFAAKSTEKEALLAYARTYAGQVKKDYKAYLSEEKEPAIEK